MIGVRVTKYQNLYVGYTVTLEVRDEPWPFTLFAAIDEDIPAIGGLQPGGVSLAHIKERDLQ